MTGDEQDMTPGIPGENSVTYFLELGVERRNRPVDLLIERLGKADGETWLAGVLEKAPDPWFLSLEGSPALEMLEEFKQQAKVDFAGADEADARMAGLLSYLFVIAAGLNCHGRLISSQPSGEIASTLLDLSAALPAPWNDYIAQAGMSSTGS